MGKRKTRQEGSGANLVPGTAQPLGLEKLRSKLIAPAAVPADSPASPKHPRRIRRAADSRAGTLILGAALSALGAMAFLGGAAPASLALRATLVAAPDVGLSPEESGRVWTRAGFDSEAFLSALGVPRDDLARREADARRLERLLSRRAHPGLD
jgi:hypothetical protein